MIEDTYYEHYIDILIRNKVWLYKIEYSKDSYFVLKCDEGPACPYKSKIKIETTRKDLPESHLLNNISKTIFNNEVQKLTIETNSERHRGHYLQSEINKKFLSRKEGCSEFAKLLIQKLKLYLKKQTERISTLKELLGDRYEWHVSSSTSLTNFYHYMRKKRTY